MHYKTPVCFTLNTLANTRLHTLQKAGFPNVTRFIRTDFNTRLIYFRDRLTIVHERKPASFASILFLTLLFARKAPAQTKLGLEPDNWAYEMSERKLNVVNNLGTLKNLPVATDSVRAFRFLDSMKASPNAKGYYFLWKCLQPILLKKHISLKSWNCN